MRKVLPLLNVLGMVIMLFSLTMLLPLGISWYNGDGAQAAYDRSILITISAGLVMWLATIKSKRILHVRDGFLLVVMIWAALPAFAAIPLLLFLPDLSFTDAYFEAMSGLTASGATVLSGLDQLPVSLNVWRTELHWIGGMGVIVLAVAILPLLGVGGREMFKAETPGPMKDTKLTPRITETAKGLWIVYVGLTALCVGAYYLAGMSPLDALIHAFSTMGLGGFSSHDASFAHFDSPAIEAVAVVFMLLAGVSFATHFLAWRGRSVRPYGFDPEAGYFLLIVLGSCVMLTLYLWIVGTYPDFLTTLRYVTFNTVSVATTTGFASADYNQWPLFVPFWMLFLSAFATSSMSTGGGIKMIRAKILFKQGLREMVRLMHPQALLPLKVGGQIIRNQIVFKVLAFLFLYVVSIITLTMAMLASGLDFLTALTAVVACINNTGPGLGLVGPASTYAVLTDFQTWICTFALLLGRLEMFTLLIVFTPSFWRK